MAEVAISSPWVTFAREVYKLFEKDPEVVVDYDNDGPTLKILVANNTKAEALAELIPTEKRFGNVTLGISVIPDNEDEAEVELFRRAFAGNPAVTDIQTVTDMFGNEKSFVVFEPVVVQFPNDNVADLHGVTSTLFQDIALGLFEGDAGVSFCTDLAEGFDGTSPAY